MKEITLYFLIALITFWGMLWLLFDYQKRMQEYNYYVCVEIYRLHENCKSTYDFIAPIPESEEVNTHE